jgi:uncharacterized membrane protein YesL
MFEHYDGTEKNTGSAPDKEWRLKRGLDAFGNMFALNICFIVGCLPIFTIGASLTALYAMCIRLQEDEEETVVAGFIHEFKRSFKQATAAFGLVVLVLVIMYGEAVYVANSSGFMSLFYTVTFYLLLVMLGLTVFFLFPLIARYDNKLSVLIKNSFMLSVGYFWSWVKVAVAWIAPIAFFIIYDTLFLEFWYLWILLLFGAIAWGTSHTIRKVFEKNEERLENRDNEEDESEDEDEEEDGEDEEKDFETGEGKE